MNRTKMHEKLDPQVAEYLKIVRSKPPAHLLSIEKLREDIDKLSNYYTSQPVKKIEEIAIPGPAGNIPVRVYTPEGKGPFLPVIFYHGGGWCIGSPKGYDIICTVLTNKIPAKVFSVGYRLAPEDPFPAAIDDCYAALKYIADNAGRFDIDPDYLTVMGDSAGGNLAAAVSLRSKDEKGPKIAFQILVYPATNISCENYESYRLFATGYDLDKEMIDIFKNHYLPVKEDRTNTYALPGLAKDLKGLPPALIITAEYDPLRDDGREFAGKLRKAGIPVKYSMYKGVIHGFLSFTKFHAAQKAFDEIADTLHNRL